MKYMYIVILKLIDYYQFTRPLVLSIDLLYNKYSSIQTINPPCEWYFYHCEHTFNKNKKVRLLEHFKPHSIEVGNKFLGCQL